MCRVMYRQRYFSAYLRQLRKERHYVKSFIWFMSVFTCTVKKQVPLSLQAADFSIWSSPLRPRTTAVLDNGKCELGCLEKVLIILVVSECFAKKRSCRLHKAAQSSHKISKRILAVRCASDLPLLVYLSQLRPGVRIVMCRSPRQ